MMKTKTSHIVRLGLLLSIICTLLVIAPAWLNTRAPATNAEQGAPLQEAVQKALGVRVAEAAAVAFNLCASDGTINLPGGGTVPVWGFVQTASCAPNLVDNTTFPGPELRVNAGDTVTINLTNELAENVSILIPGQNLEASGGTPGLFAAEAVANGGTVSYTFTAQEGTYLYESGSNASIQLPMGLYGALIVDSGFSGQVYGKAFDQEAILLLSEIDPNLNADPGGFDLLDYHPTYWLVNGKGYPATDNITATPGDQVLVRYLNAGFDHPSMMLLGAYQEVVAKDSYPLTNSFNVVAETIPAGSTADMLVDTTGLEGSLPLYNRNMYVTNADAYPGGMLTFIEVATPVGDPPTIDIVSPVPGDTLYGDAVLVQISAADTEDDANLGAGNLTVEWRLDGGTWQPAAWDGSSYYAATWDTTLAGDGAHTINARVTDSSVPPNTTTDSNGVVVSNTPAVSVVAPAEGATIFGDTLLVQIDAQDAEDTSLTVMWGVDGDTSQTATYNSGSGYYEATLATTGLGDGAHSINAQATDSRAFAGSDSNNVSVSNLPSLTIVVPADGANVVGQVTVRIDAADAEDDANNGAGNLTVTWDVDGGSAQSTTYNAGTGYYEANWDTTAVGPGSYVINAQMMDSRGNPAGDSNNVVVTPPNSIHIGDLDDVSVQAAGPNWSARVTAEVHDIHDAPVAGATVYMDVIRTAKAGGTVADNRSCVTGTNGRCTIPQTVNQNQYENSVTFTVTDVTNPPADPYDSSLNHDPDNDQSDGTTLVVQQP